MWPREVAVTVVAESEADAEADADAEECYVGAMLEPDPKWPQN